MTRNSGSNQSIQFKASKLWKMNNIRNCGGTSPSRRTFSVYILFILNNLYSWPAGGFNLWNPSGAARLNSDSHLHGGLSARQNLGYTTASATRREVRGIGRRLWQSKVKLTSAGHSMCKFAEFM